MYFNIQIPRTKIRIFSGSTGWQRFVIPASIEINKSLSIDVWFLSFTFLKWFITVQFGKDSKKVNV